MEILLFTDNQGNEHFLTTNSPASHYGIPAYRIEDEDCAFGTDYGPAEFIRFAGLPLLAGGVVAFWARMQGRSKHEMEVARQFCAQNPDGPQI